MLDQPGYYGDSDGAWRAARTWDYVIIALNAGSRIGGVVTQGNGNADEWVTRIKVFASDGGVVWAPVSRPRCTEDCQFDRDDECDGMLRGTKGPFA